MSRDNIYKFAIAVVIGLLLLALALTSFPAAPATAALAPTPVANLAPSSSALNVTFQGQTVIAADTNTASKQLIGYEYMDISFTIDQESGSVNTATFTVQFSNDDSNWDNGPAILSANAVDITDITRIPLFGRYVRINQDVTNTNNVTVTILAVAK